LKLFAKAIEGVICFNPGTVVRGEVPGTYASMYVDPLFLPSMGLDDEKLPKKAMERIRVDVSNI
jgi:hypothetical protein